MLADGEIDALTVIAEQGHAGLIQLVQDPRLRLHPRLTAIPEAAARQAQTGRTMAPLEWQGSRPTA